VIREDGPAPVPPARSASASSPDEPNPDGIWLVGVLNPYGGDPDMALVNYPANCSGHRLWRILGIDEDRYLALRRRNLCTDRWSRALATAAAYDVYAEVPELAPGRPASLVVLLGADVADAFRGIASSGRLRRGRPAPLDLWEASRDAAGRASWLCLPHPSGMNRAWNGRGGEPSMWEPGGTVDRARRLLSEFAPHVPWGALPGLGQPRLAGS
jgi:hypothetical protein